MRILDRLRADFISATGALRALRMTMPIARNPTRVFPDVIAELAEKFGDAPALLSDRECLSYRALAARANRYARWAQAHGIAKGDTVGLLMPNRPEYMAIWLGLMQAGGVVALINTHLTGISLAHCIDATATKHIIVASELLDALALARPALAGDPTIFVHGASNAAWPRIDLDVEQFSDAPLAASERAALTIEDRALYIYTSGTTGMPKAANFNHYRLMLACFGFASVMATRPSDRMYNCLPMYHTAGGLVATGAVLVGGGSVVIREKFSAQDFWSDVVRFECTLFQYIGELCRYLINTPPHPDEARHKLRLCCGNGLRPEIWPEFQRRFAIPQIVEFYAATEGNVSLFNTDGKLGAVGRIPWFLAALAPTRIIKLDGDSLTPVRDARGFCIACADGEPGEAIGRILNDPSKPGARFEGYAAAADNRQKILHDVFVPGDAWFRTGDLMRTDADGYFYFVDRIGDTFRWKGENVATSEVVEIVSGFVGVVDACVYGIAVPGCDGRAGMAALVTDENFDLPEFRDYLMQRLPDYARPIFLRLLREIAVTTTFKQKKTEMVRQGADPSAIPDRLYFDDPRAEAYVPMEPALYKDIVSGRIRL